MDMVRMRKGERRWGSRFEGMVDCGRGVIYGNLYRHGEDGA